MASAKDLRKRITSVKNTQQITRAMKMVSAAKLRRAQENIFQLRPFSLELGKVLYSLSQSTDKELSHPLLSPRETTEKKALVILVTSDRGLCGAFNGNIIKGAQRFLREHGSSYKRLDFAFIGKKGFEFFKTRRPGKYYEGFFTGLNFAKSKVMAEELIQLYLSGEYDEIRFLYNEFKSALSQVMNNDVFLPIRSVDVERGNEGAASAVMTLYEPNPQRILDELLPRHFATQIQRMLLESLASEHGARMSAMENATKNAGEMIKKITLLYNKTRQAGITKELLEITSGSEAQKG